MILDVNMPHITGIEMLTALRDNHLIDCIPVVMLTTSTRPQDELQCRELGVKDYLVKPEQFEDLVQLARSLTKYFTPIS